MNCVRLGERIRTCRKAKGLTQEVLAEMVDISVPFMGYLERGDRVPSVQTFIALCNALDASPSYLLANELSDLNLSLNEQDDMTKKDKLIYLLQLASQVIS